MRRLLEKLPQTLRMRWISKRKQHGYTFPALIAFIEEQANIAKDIKFFESKAAGPSHRKSDGSKSKSPLPVHQTHPATRKVIKCLFCKREGHAIFKCFKFDKLDIHARWKAVVASELCYRCLDHHISDPCLSSDVCSKCGAESHHTLLHKPTKESDKVNVEVTRDEAVARRDAIEGKKRAIASAESKPPGATGDDSLTAAPVSTITDPHPDGRTMLKIMPVMVQHQLCAYAFIDGGSVPTLISRKLVDDLGIRGRRCSQVMRTECGDFHCNEVVSLTLSDSGGENEMFIEEAFVTDRISVTTNHLMPVHWLEAWPYLRDVSVHRLPEGEEEVHLIIGLNTSLNRTILDQRHGEESEPSAYLTKLGWVVFGPTGSQGSKHAAPAPVCRISVEEEDITTMLKSSYDRDFWEKEIYSAAENSVEDNKFLESVEASISRCAGRYEVGIPFKNNIPLPNNKLAASKRADSLKKKLEGCESFKLAYGAQIEKYLAMEYAEKVPRENLRRDDGLVWYLPHFAVFHPTKRKIRVVFDPKVKYAGHSLNDHILPGPDMTNYLPGVLLRFRKGQFAVTADVQEMYHQVKVPAMHRDVLRFLWWPGGDTSRSIEEYRMSSHPFGIRSSAGVVNYCLRRTAQDVEDKYTEEVREAVVRNFYVDNLLKSMDGEEACINFAREIRELCAEGGFRLNQWTSSSKKVLATIPCSERDESVASLDLSIDQLPIERTLGIHWAMETDSFTFRVNMQEKPSTRRGALSVVASVYDPIGVLSPFTLRGKLLLQDMCRRNATWDEVMTSEELTRWNSWIDQLPRLSEFSLGRSFVPVDFGAIVRVQLHHFCDASETAYGVASYIRFENDVGRVHCTLVFGKARVAPMKRMTIPRLELTAAAVAAQIDKKLRAELDYEISSSVFWTDSTAVLKYLFNETARYHTFVANRIALIKDLTKLSDWRYVNTSCNPADLASRGMSVDEFLGSKVWLYGPSFLLLDASCWPTLPADVSLHHTLDDPEIKKSLPVYDITAAQQPFVEYVAGRFSSWIRFTRCIILIFRFHAKLRRQMLDAPQSKISNIVEAEKHIWLLVQQSYFPKDIEKLNKGEQLNKSSPIIRLRPFLQDGLLKVGGRQREVHQACDDKPVILPAKSNAVKILVRDMHVRLGHCGQNYLMAELRRKYWIVHGNSVVRSVIRECVDCKRMSARPMEQIMSDLPLERLSPDHPPFTFVGTDCFGPFYTKRGRSTIKRYGAIFTCLCSRAVHIEMLDNMDTDAYVNALRRFVARRGTVQKIWSDNGSNIAAAEKELRQSLQALKQSEIASHLSVKGIDWHFHPPHASNFGGVWERMIRSTRRIMTGICREQVTTDDRLNTLFCEVEAILNGRPLTRVNDDPECLDTLTPAMLLTMKKATGPVTISDRKDVYVKRQWRQVQYLADVFWKRWVREYLPLLQERQKWVLLRKDLAVGSVVLSLDEKLPRGTWPLARVLEVYRSADGHVRSAKIKTENGIYVRPLNKMCLLLESEIPA